MVVSYLQILYIVFHPFNYLSTKYAKSYVFSYRNFNAISIRAILSRNTFLLSVLEPKVRFLVIGDADI